MITVFPSDFHPEPNPKPALVIAKGLFSRWVSNPGPGATAVSIQTPSWCCEDRDPALFGHGLKASAIKTHARSEGISTFGF
jgi:hypothetical protein